MSTKWKILAGDSAIFHVHEVENLAGQLYYISFPRSGKVLENSTVLHVHKVEKSNGRTLRYFMSTKWKGLAGEFYDISCQRSGMLS